MASRYGFLGSIDSNTGDPLLGWDTDQFPMDVKKTTQTMLVVIRQGGLAPGGLNFDCKVRRESTDIEDMFIAHIGKKYWRLYIGDCIVDGQRMTLSSFGHLHNTISNIICTQL
jgi:xylose isomerase